MNDSKREIRMSQINDPASWGNPSVCQIDDPVWECEGTGIRAAIRRIRTDGPLHNFTRTIRRVETIVNFKDEFGRGDRPDWNEFVSPDRIWRRYARADRRRLLANENPRK